MGEKLLSGTGITLTKSNKKYNSSAQESFFAELSVSKYLFQGKNQFDLYPVCDCHNEHAPPVTSSHWVNTQVAR